MLKRLTVGLTGLVLGVLVLLALAIVVFRPEPPAPVAIDVTRYLQRIDPGVNGGGIDADFPGIPGAARLAIACPVGVTHVAVRLNGAHVLDPARAIDCTGGFEVPVMLAEHNSITIRTVESTAAPTTLRIRQRAEVALHVLSRVHYNVNVSDFAASRAFYGQLGFGTISGFPDANTQAMARAIGIETPTPYDGAQGGEAGGYLLHGELIGLGGLGGAIDLIEFAIPRNESPPYRALNHLGMARAALITTDVDADHRTLTRNGVRFLSAPVARADGSRFAIFTDPDGAFHELVQPAVIAPGDAGHDGLTRIVDFGALVVNVSDLERSQAWYRMFGFEPALHIAPIATDDEARALGFEPPVRIDGARLAQAVDGSTLDLVQWLEPFDPSPPYPLPVNHLGIHRTALATTDIAADVATLQAQGVTFVSPITPCCSGPDSSGSIVAFLDPDGTVVELVEQPLVSVLLPSLLRMRSLIDSWNESEPD